MGHIVQCRPHPTAAQKRRLRCQESGQARSCCALAAACASKRFSGICIISPRVGVRTRRERRGDPGRNETGSHSRTRGSRRQQLHHFLEKSTFARLSNSPTLEAETKTLRIWTWGGAPSSNPRSFVSTSRIEEVVPLSCFKPLKQVVQFLAARPQTEFIGTREGRVYSVLLRKQTPTSNIVYFQLKDNYECIA